MKIYDATETAYKNGFAACAEMLRKFRPGDIVTVNSKYGRKTGIVTDWILAATRPDVMYLVRVGTREEYFVAGYKADDLELVKRQSYETENPQMPDTLPESETGTLSVSPIPFIFLHEDDTGSDLCLRIDTVTAAKDGVVMTEHGAWCVKESAEEIITTVHKLWELAG